MTEDKINDLILTLHKELRDLDLHEMTSSSLRDQLYDMVDEVLAMNSKDRLRALILNYIYLAFNRLKIDDNPKGWSLERSVYGANQLIFKALNPMVQESMNYIQTFLSNQGVILERLNYDDWDYQVIL